MIVRVSTSERPTVTGRHSAWRLLVLATCAAALLLTPGCGGCLRRVEKTDEELLKEEEERLARLKEKEEKPPLETRHLLCQPNEGKLTYCWCKPGHWTAVSLFGAKANHNDFDGELEFGVVDTNGNPLSLEGMGYTMSGIRPAPLPKGQPKNFEAMVFVPGTIKQARIASRILERRSGRTALEFPHPVGKMLPYQYHFVVLARLPGSYGYLKELVCFRSPSSVKTAVSESQRNYYRLTYQAGDQPSSLPPHALYWTSIAYLLWDDADPAALRPEQQTALLDWLHWGGQLIISGPDSLDRLGNTFLTPHLPATSPGRRNLTAQDVTPLSDSWRTSGKRVNPPLVPAQPWAGTQLTKHPEARYVPGTGELVIERRVGRGRIVVTAFPLTVRELIGWKSFDGFFNGCLLGRPVRYFYIDSEGVNRVTWAEAARTVPAPRPANAGGADFMGQTSAQISAADPAQTCKLRYFTRDTQRDSSLLSPTPPVSPSPGPRRTFTDPGLDPEMEEKYLPDVGSWRDFNAVAGAARTSLQNAARIEVPDPKFVLWVLGGYLLVLVPVNWAFFRLLGRGPASGNGVFCPAG